MIKKRADNFINKIFKSIGTIILIRSVKSPKNFKSYMQKTGRCVTYVLAFDLVFVFLFPFLFMIFTSLKTNADLNDVTVNWIPTTFNFKNYVMAYKLINYNEHIKNSLLITIGASIGHIISCSFIGYGFARYEFPLKNVLFVFVIVVLIVPIQTFIVPMYILFSNMKWLNTYLPIIAPTFFGLGLKGALFIFIFRQFYLGLPKELEKAAKVDGCGFLRTYWNIVLPIARSALIVTLVLSIVWHWNDFYEPAIYVYKPTLAVLPARLNSLVTFVNKPPEELMSDVESGLDEDALNNAVLMAGTFIVILPVIISFIFLQRKFMQGIERTGLAGD